MRPSRWDDWVVPDYRGESADPRTHVVPTRHNRRLVKSAIDPKQPEPIDAMIAAEGRSQPVLMPLFPVGFFLPTSADQVRAFGRVLVPEFASRGDVCPHHGPIPEGSTLCCMVCHQSGMDGHPGLKETAAGKLRLKGWEPEDGEDQWGRATEATTYEGQPEATGARKPRLAQFRRTP